MLAMEVLDCRRWPAADWEPQFVLDPGARLLVAEDCPDTQQLLRYMLDKDGYELVFAASGEEAVEMALFAQAMGEGFDLILLDLRLPERDGHSAARLLRAKGIKVPIVAMTASYLPGDEAESIAAGCSFHVVKRDLQHYLRPLLRHALGWASEAPPRPSPVI
jgi:CheY-like chemotaxis protein